MDDRGIKVKLIADVRDYMAALDEAGKAHRRFVRQHVVVSPLMWAPIVMAAFALGALVGIYLPS